MTNAISTARPRPSRFMDALLQEYFDGTQMAFIIRIRIGLSGFDSNTADGAKSSIVARCCRRFAWRQLVPVPMRRRPWRIQETLFSWDIRLPLPQTRLRGRLARNCLR